MAKKIIVGITGASGAIYAQRLLHYLEESPLVETINLVITSAATTVIREELSLKFSGVRQTDAELLLGRPTTKIKHFPAKDIGASIASGSYPVDAMVIIPCSVNTLGMLAAGIVRDLVHRAADVTLKESRRLILVPRETPLNRIHLENLLKLHQAGATIIPAMPAFYHNPSTILDLVDHFVFRILDHLGVAHSDESIWQGRTSTNKQ
ncbi:MAG: UbiX family flavin prenyltransferase [Blastocatellia bacterium]|nr:UbiX family flavin prenyltransferase [Blastocatellia bacterium]MBL8193545.1 UbiX family flavin prenyltransferase [Blastocatellia bacterium]MBN8725132.1 UbiX family flavin prenyltransferase [Acidobacteriota bacterium]